MKKIIKINFIDEFPGFKIENEYIYKLLCDDYDVQVSDNPDIAFVACFGHSHLDYDCVKVLVSGENQIPDFNLFDYAIGFDPIEFGDRYLRMPLFPFYKTFTERDRYGHLTDGELVNRKFCSFVVSNNKGDPLREAFFRELSKYKHIDSGGRYLNNVGGPVVDKIDFCAGYKFNIAFENSAAPGYTTEKVMEPLVSRSLPIYYGNPMIAQDVNPEAMVVLKSRDDVARAIEEIIRLDKDEAAYLAHLHQPAFVHDKAYYDQQMKIFLHAIIDQPKDAAKRVIQYGCQPRYRNRMRDAYQLQDKLAVPRKILKRICPF